MGAQEMDLNSRQLLKNLLLATVAIGLTSARLWAAPIDLSHARIVVLNPRQTTAAKAAAMLRDEVEKRTRITLEIVLNLPSGEEPLILIGTAQDLAAQTYRPPADGEVPAKADAYALWIDRRKAPVVCAAGHDGRGTVFAVGRLLRLLEMGRDMLQLDSGTKLDTAP